MIENLKNKTGVKCTGEGLQITFLYETVETKDSADSRRWRIQDRILKTEGRLIPFNEISIIPDIGEKSIKTAGVLIRDNSDWKLNLYNLHRENPAKFSGLMAGLQTCFGLPQLSCWKLLLKISDFVANVASQDPEQLFDEYLKN